MRIFIVSFTLLVLAGCSSTRNLTAVTDFNVERYMGVWYEAARYPHRFEKGMSSVSAAYTLNDDGTVTVLNRGFVDAKADWKQVEGVAKFKGDPQVGWLKVSFFGPFYATYKIVYLNDAYTRAIVAGPNYNYLWILSRDSNLPKDELDSLILKAEQMGYARDKLLIVDQSANVK
ncbi:lipocalin family protein [Pontiella sp.]|uniref:lipocalin family protein n=1 Tax=Pontiella sp. TaxID=2837462 RepID=UPI003562B428